MYIKKHIKNGLSASHMRYPDEHEKFEFLFVAAHTSKFKTGGVIGNLRMENNEISNVRECGYS